MSCTMFIQVSLLCLHEDETFCRANLPRIRKYEGGASLRRTVTRECIAVMRVLSASVAHMFCLFARATPVQGTIEVDWCTRIGAKFRQLGHSSVAGSGAISSGDESGVMTTCVLLLCCTNSVQLECHNLTPFSLCHCGRHKYNTSTGSKVDTVDNFEQTH